MAYVYRHIRLDKNEPFYIGIGSDKKYKRAYKKIQRNIFWNRIVNKTDYEVEILIDDLTWEEACEKEKEFISLYGRRDLKSGTLVNLTNGGEGMLGSIVKDETKIKLSKANKGFKHSEETKKKMSLSRLGKKHSQETKNKISQNKLNITEETRRKLSEANRGKKLSEEQKKKISESKKGKKVYFSEKHRKNLSLALKNYHLKLKENGND